MSFSHTSLSYMLLISMALLAITFTSNFFYLRLKGNGFNSKLGLLIAFFAFLGLLLFYLCQFLFNLALFSSLNFKLLALFLVYSSIFYFGLTFLRKIFLFGNSITITYQPFILVSNLLFSFGVTVVTTPTTHCCYNYISLGTSLFFNFSAGFMIGTIFNTMIFIANLLPNYINTIFTTKIVSKTFSILFNHIKIYSTVYLVLFETSSYFRYFDNNKIVLSPKSFLTLSFLLSITWALASCLPKKLKPNRISLTGDE